MRTLIKTAILALFGAFLAYALVRTATAAPVTSCANVAMPAAVRSAVALCESDEDCVTAEFEARAAYCAKPGNSRKAYCVCAFDGHVGL